MQKVIDQITDKFTGQIGTERPFYSPQQLLKAEIPVYIVERIRLLLEDKVLSELKKTDSVWVDTENKLFVSAQKDFENAAISCSVIPHEKLYDILHATVSDIVSVLVEPRKNIAPYIFREESVLTFEEVSKRCARLMVYKHFGTAIPLYMKKRELDELTIERCQSLVSNLDARIVSDYTAENWSQKLEMLFSLCGGKLAPELLQRFFRDKGFDNTADIFSSIDVAVTQSTFIEMLSTENFKMELIKEQESEVKSVSESTKPAEVAEEVKEEIPEEAEENLASLFQSEAVEPDINEILGDIEEEETLVFDNVDDSESLNNIFLNEDENDDAEEEEEHYEPVSNQKEDKQAFKSNLTSILDQAKDSYEGVVQEDEGFESELIEEDDLIMDAPDPAEETKDPILEEHISSEEEESSEDEEEKPMWAQFLSEDQMEVMMASREEEEETESEPTYNTLVVEDEDDEIFMEEEAVEDSSATMELNEYLMDSEERWVSDVFSGKQKAYDRGINELGQFDNWNEASVFLEKEIFSKQKVDMFSEEAGEFIDTLQSYFKEYKS